MSNQDSQFFNVFSVVIGMLVAVAIVLMMLARYIGTTEQLVNIPKDPRYIAAVAQRVGPLVHEAVGGQDNSALAIKETAPGGAGSAAAPAMPKDGTEVYNSVCQVCHGAGIGGAPKAGDKAAWAPRLAQGTATLYQHALQGFSGKAGAMPAKGGRADLSDALVKEAVDHMIGMVK